MRGWLLAPLLAASGCLYLGRVNQPPSISYNAAQPTSTTLGAQLRLGATASDDEDDPIDLIVTYVVKDAVTNVEADPRCDYNASEDDHHGHVTLQFFRTGTFLVYATVKDHRGAEGETSLMLSITNAPPVFGMDVKPQQSSGGGNLCDKNSAGETITIGLAGPKGVPLAQDPDAIAPGTGCGGGTPFTATWRIVGQPAGTKAVLTKYLGNGCDGRAATSGPSLTVDSPTTQVCLWTDANFQSGVGMYTVVMEISDGVSTTASPAVDIPVGPNELPCIASTTPTIGGYVIDRTEHPYTLWVNSATDDQDVLTSAPDSPIKFVWSISTESDPTWRDVPDYTLPSYDLDPTTFGVGEVVHVRVEVLDSRGVRALDAGLCQPTVPDCDVISCADKNIGGTCHKWRTWDLELR
jgi:hypothetical protein